MKILWFYNQGCQLLPKTYFYAYYCFEKIAIANLNHNDNDNRAIYFLIKAFT